MTITGTAGDWYKVDTTIGGRGISGFVHSSYITMSSGSGNSGSSDVTPSSGEGVCNTSVLNVRKEASTNSGVYGTITSGTKVTILEQAGTGIRLRQWSMAARLLDLYIQIILRFPEILAIPAPRM